MKPLHRGRCCVRGTVASLLLFCLWSCDSEVSPEPAPVVSCDQELGGVDWGDSAPVESVSGLAEELEELDLSQLPPVIDISGVTGLYRGYLAYALELAPTELGDSLDRDEIQASGELGQVVLGSLLLGQSDPLGMDINFYRRGLARYYACVRQMPLTLEGFRSSIFDYLDTEGTVVDSVAKCTERRLRADYPNQVFVAETLVDNEVRETEIVLGGRRGDGQLDFVVYDAEGDLTNRSLFPTISGGEHVVVSGPYSCMTCHGRPEEESSAWVFDIDLPEVGPCAE